MAAAAVQKDRLNELLHCPICIDVFTDPRTLPCLHTFCFKCLSDCYKGKKSRNRVACPECRQEFTIPDSGIDGLKKNFFIGHLLSINEANLDETKKVAAEFRTGKQEQDLRAAIRKVEENLSVLNSTKLTFFDQVKRVEADIRDEADQMIQLIKNDAKKLLSDLNRIRTVHKQEIERASQEFTEAKLQLTKLADFCCELVRKGSDGDIFREADSLRSRTEELIQMKKLGDVVTNLSLTNVIFSPSGVTCDDNKNILGQVESVAQRHPVAQKRTLEPEAGSSTHYSKRRIVDENTLSNEVTPTVAHTLLGDANKKITALALMDDELFVTRYQSKHISVYDSTSLQLRRSIEIAGLGRQSAGLAACSTNKLLFVSDWSNAFIHRVDLSTDQITYFKVSKFPRGLSMSRKRNVLVTCSNKVQEFTPAGTLQRELSLNNCLWQAVETPDEEAILVSQCGPIHGVVALTWEGLVLLSCGDEAGSGQGQMYSPRSLSVTTMENVLVVDMFNNRINMFNSSLTIGQSLRLPADADVQRPIAMCYDESRGRLFVGEYGGRNRLLAFDHVTNV